MRVRMITRSRQTVGFVKRKRKATDKVALTRELPKLRGADAVSEELAYTYAKRRY